MKKYTVEDCALVHLKSHPSPRLGNLSVVTGGVEVPFDMRRVFFIYDVPGGASRGGHAHREVSEFVVAVAGSFCITLDDGVAQRTFMLNRPNTGLLIRPGIWLTLHDFSSGAVALVLTSDHFSHSDHIKSYVEFKALRSASIS